MVSTNISTEKITILVNGEPLICLKNLSLVSLLNYLDLDFRQNVIEYNSEIIKKDNLSSIIVQNNDVIEIVTIVGGG